MTHALESARFRALQVALEAPAGGIRFVRAPGRVNLIGDHTDYQDGLCLPIAIDRDVLVGFRPRSDDVVRVQSLDLDTEIELAPPADGATIAGVEPWARPIAATIEWLSRRSPVPFRGFDAAVTSTVPIGAGLSSSAAFEVGVAMVAATVNDVHLAATELALAAQEIEHLASGVPCGIMDQLTSVGGVAGSALLLDCRTLGITNVPIPTTAGVLVAHSGVERQLVTSEYAQRRAACEAAAARLGLPTLRDATIEEVADDPIARHVVTENARVAAFANALEHGDLETAGTLMLASHQSLRDDFGVSTAELDLLVELSIGAGSFGARLTGAGFGGCIVALAPRDDLERIAAEVTGRYRSQTGREANAFVVSAVDGAGLVEPS